MDNGVENSPYVAACCDNVSVMNKGKCVLSGDVRSVFSNADYLESIDLDIPQITRLIARLRNMGYDFDKNILTVEDAIEAVYGKIKGMKEC